jgi:hypothetical protein
MINENKNFESDKGGVDDDLIRYNYSEEVKQYIVDSCIDSFALYEYSKKFNKILGKTKIIYLNPLFDEFRNISGVIICIPTETKSDYYYFKQAKNWYDAHSNDETDIELVTLDQYYNRNNNYDENEDLLEN